LFSRFPRSGYVQESLEGTDVKVTVGLRRGSKSWQKAEAEGFSEQDGTLGEMFQIIENSDLVILLISDGAQTELYQKIMNNMKPSSTLGLSHGFLLGHMKNIGDKWREDINIVMVAPKGMGPSVRQLYLQGKDTNGAGINSSIAIEQDVTGNATDLALAWAIAIGSPYIFETSMEFEYRSDLFGERGILLGGEWAITEFLFELYCHSIGMEDIMAFKTSVECIRPISRTISKKGILALYNDLKGDEYNNKKNEFRIAYLDAYSSSMPLLHEIYDEVASGNEIKSVIMANERMKIYPMVKIDNTYMWKEVGKEVIDLRDDREVIKIYPFTAGFYCGMMMAQINLLIKKGHSWSEIVNESVIEAVDSLNPYMHARGLSYMVDNCSITARLGTRKWGPRFMSEFKRKNQCYITKFEDFTNHQVHEALAVCSEFRPSVDISVS
jgi:ketol-acid reductoisomerase